MNQLCKLYMKYVNKMVTINRYLNESVTKCLKSRERVDDTTSKNYDLVVL